MAAGKRYDQKMIMIVLNRCAFEFWTIFSYIYRKNYSVKKTWNFDQLIYKIRCRQLISL